jgi:hypothetical protein
VQDAALMADVVAAAKSVATAAPVEEQPVRAVLAADEVSELTSEEYNSLSRFVDQLYQQVSEEAGDSPSVSEPCLSLLRGAREALEDGDFASAEYKAEQVKARLLRARASAVAAESLGLKLIWLWQLFTGFAAAVAVLLPFFVQLVPGFVPLMRALALGTLGGVMVALWNLSHYLHNREYDPAYNADYWLSPIRGAFVGGVIFIISALGLVAAPGAPGTTRIFGSLSSANLLMYFLALLGGIAQDYIFEFVRGVLAAVFRSPTRSSASLPGGDPARQ